MIPIAPTIFWGPMAYAIMGGLAVATVLTLVFLPALYVTWFRVKRPHQDACQRVDTEQTPRRGGGRSVAQGVKKLQKHFDALLHSIRRRMPRR
jgi:hypothetical protein